MAVAVIINPISGARGSAAAGRQRAELARALLDRHRIKGEVFVTERAGHAVDLARAAVHRGASLVVAWGGDGTVNEVGTVLAFGPAALAIIPAGSGNGLARELAIPAHPARALEAALRGRDRLVDAGQLGDRLFFNLAGIGVDAEVARRFNARHLGRRGLVPYISTTIAVLLAPPRAHYAITQGQRTTEHDPLLIALANSRQYGNGAQIAPNARVDDGLLDLVVVEAQSPLRNLWRARRLFLGTLADDPAVTMASVDQATIASDRPILFHVDGEPCLGDCTLTARVCPAALRIRV